MNSLRYIFDQGFTVEEIDALTGPLIGHPKTATFRLSNLAGIDISVGVASNLYDAVPDDESREALQVPPMLQTMVAQGKLGNKSGQGFYKEVRQGSKKEYWVLNFATMEYQPPRQPEIPLIAAAARHRKLPERLTFLMSYADEHPDDRYARSSQMRSCRHWPTLPGACQIADRISSLDHAMQWGYAQELGPFEAWDAMGVHATVERMRSRDIAVAPWVDRMLAEGNETFYVQRDGQQLEWSPAEGGYIPLPHDPHAIDLQTLKQAGKEIASNPSAESDRPRRGRAAA